jgi:hypothetical protein
MQVSVWAQRNDSFSLSINIVPQYVFINGIKADIECKITDDIHLYGGGQFYTGLVNSDGSESVSKSGMSTADQSKRSNDNINGNGYHFGAKYYFTRSGIESYYIGAEATYNTYDFKLNDYSYFPYIDDGLQFYEYRLGEINAKSTQMACSVNAGMTQNYGRFVFNVWAGLAFTQAKTSDNFHTFRKNDTFFWGYAFDGWSPNVGLKAGFLLF